MAVYNLSLDRAATFSFSFVLDESYDATGVSAAMVISDSQSLHKVSHPMAIVEQMVSLVLPPAVTATFSPHKTYRYVIDFTMPSGVVVRILEGTLGVSLSIGADVS